MKKNVKNKVRNMVGYHRRIKKELKKFASRHARHTTKVVID